MRSWEGKRKPNNSNPPEAQKFTDWAMLTPMRSVSSIKKVQENNNNNK
jgi:hypothetical protein